MRRKALFVALLAPVPEGRSYPGSQPKGCGEARQQICLTLGCSLNLLNPHSVVLIPLWQVGDKPGKEGQDTPDIKRFVGRISKTRMTAAAKATAATAPNSLGSGTES